jgi:glucosylceramidase
LAVRVSSAVRLALALVLSGCALVAAPADAHARNARLGPKLGPWVSVTLTRASLRAALKPMRPLRFSSAPVNVRTLDLNPAVSYQQMIGFGAAMTDSSAWLLHEQLPPAVGARVMRSLFSASGIHLSFTRVPIGASDFTAKRVPYTYDDLPVGQADPRLRDFSIAHDKAYIIPALREMLAVNPEVKVLASEWSPPAWMKANGALNNLHGQGTPLRADYAVLAFYIAEFIVAYQQHGIAIWGLTPQNEPYARVPYPGMRFTSRTEALFISRDLAPILALGKLHTKVFGDDDTRLGFAEGLMKSPAARDLGGMAWHCYKGQQEISQFHRRYPAMVNLLSECSPGIIPYSAAEVAIDGARNWASGINLWNLALNKTGGPVEPPDQGCPHCTGLVTVSEPSHTATYNANYYELGQVSKFVQPGAVRIDTQRWVSDFTVPGKHGPGGYGVSKGLDNVAFRNPDGGYVLICHENSDAPVTFGVQAGGLRFKYRLPGHATVTFTWRS